MKCPFCGFMDSSVRDSRPIGEGLAIKRRRVCPECEGRFVTFERIEAVEITVIKRNGTKKPLDQAKLLKSLTIAARKRPITEAQLEDVVFNIAKTLERSGETEISSATIGNLAMAELAKIDQIAYIRYASVYKDFNYAADFTQFIHIITQSKK